MTTYYLNNIFVSFPLTRSALDTIAIDSRIRVFEDRIKDLEAELLQTTAMDTETEKFLIDRDYQHVTATKLKH